MKINCIVAVCENSGIGFKGSLPWKLKNELKFFSRITNQKQHFSKKNVVIMGRKTYFSIPETKRPLQNRLNLVLTRNFEAEKYPKDVFVCSSFEDALDRLNKPDVVHLVENIWVIGGSSVFKEAMASPFCHRLYLTKINANFECDVFLPPIPSNFKVIDADENVPNEIQVENGIEYKFLVFEKVENKIQRNI